MDADLGIRQKTTSIEALTKRLEQWRIEAQADKDQNAEDLASVDDDDDAELELNDKDEILKDFLSQIEEVGTRVKSGKLTQFIKNVQSGKEARVQVGASEAGAERVERQDIQDIITQDKGIAQIGVYGGKGAFD